MRGIRRRLVLLAAATLAVAGLSSTLPGSSGLGGAGLVSAAVHQAPRTQAAAVQVPHTKAAWQADLRHVRTPGTGCFSSSYPALTWHAVECGPAPRVPAGAARSATSTSNARPAQVGGGTDGQDYVTTVPGYISEATGTFWDVDSAITEYGQIGGMGAQVQNALSLQLNSNLDFTTAACATSGNLNCSGWQQFLYTYGASGSTLGSPQIYMQYWLFNYGAAATPSACPANWNYAAATATGGAGCWINSKAVTVPAVTATDLDAVVFTGTATTGGTDEVQLTVGLESYAFSAPDSMLDLAAAWKQTEWGVYGDAGGGEANFGADTSLEAQTALEVSSGQPTVSCTEGNFTGESNNLTLTTTPPIDNQGELQVASAQTNDTAGISNCPIGSVAPTQAAGLVADALTGTWQAQSDLDSTGSPQPQPNTTADCGNWSDGDGTQVVGLGNGDDLWSFGDTFLGPAVARQDFFNNSVIDNSMVVQDGSSFTTVTGGTGCASGQPTVASAPITAAPGGGTIWPASSIAYGSDVEKFYYTVNSDLVQQTPEVAEIPQAALESGDTYSAQALALDGCVSGDPVMWGAATVASGGYTYIYGSQQFSGSGGNTGGEGGDLYLARSVGDPSDQGSWEYYTTSGWSSQGAACGGLTLAALGGTEPIAVPTEFSVTYVNGDFWLVDQDPANGDEPGWAVAHEAATPTGFSLDPAASVDLFEPTQAAFSGIDDNVSGLTHYSVRMLDPSAVTPSQPGSVVIAYNVNDSYLDTGCISLLDYDANAYRPRFVDVPISDLASNLDAAASPALGEPARTAASPATTGKQAVSAADGSPALPAQAATLPTPGLTPALTPALTPVGLGPQSAALTGSQAAASTPWTYDPDTVPPPSSDWGSTCARSFAGVSTKLDFIQDTDGSVEVTWPNRGVDVWYWFHWQDDTSDPGTWNENEFWTEGPNADGYLIAPPTGATASNAKTVYQLFTLPSGTNPGDQFSFWVQAFAAGNGAVVSPDSSANAKSYTPLTPSETVSGLTATAGADAVTLNWTAAPPPIAGQAIWYSVRYMTPAESDWTYTTDYISNTADMAPLFGGQEYEFEVAVTDAETNLATAAWSAPILATPNT